MNFKKSEMILKKGNRSLRFKAIVMLLTMLVVS